MIFKDGDSFTVPAEAGPVPSICIVFGGNDAEQPTKDEQEFFLVMQACFDKFIQRNRKRQGVWRRSGLKGQTKEIFAKAERMFYEVIKYDTVPDGDDFEDIVNYTIFALILMRDFKTNGGEEAVTAGPRRFLLNGKWPW
jgi:hypothetical protein